MSNDTSASPVEESSRLDPTIALLELSGIMLGTTPLNEVLAQIAHLAKRTIPRADEVSVTLFEGEKARSVAFTGDVAVHLDERQYEAGFGPCMDAAATGNTVQIRDTAAEQVYADFARQARRAGVTHSVAIGMPIPQRTIGALNIYGKTGQPLDDEALFLARTFASYAAVAMANAALYTSTAELAEHMQKAMASRAVIEQAKGILMAQQNCSADEAFIMLATASQHTNRKLRDVAQDLVDRSMNGG